MKPRQWMQIAVVASAVGLTGGAIAQDMDRTSPSSGNASLNSAAQLGDSATNPAPGALPDNGMNGSSDSTLDNGAAGTTQGSTMASPRSSAASDASAPPGGARYGSGSSATSISGSDRLGNTTSDNFNTWSSDYASQHNGRTMDQQYAAPARTGTDVQPGDMGPGNSRGE